MQTRHRQRLRRVLVATSGGAFLVSLLIAVSGGVAFRIAGVAVRADTPGKAWLVGVACAMTAGTLGGFAALRADLESAWRGRDGASVRVALCATIAAAAVGLAWGTWAASGADASGYVSQAMQWKARALAAPVPLAAGAPWPAPEWTLAPLGWRPAITPGAIVPTYAPGLPMVMGLAASIAGDSAVFWIVPLAGALAVWWTWRLGVRLTSRTAAAMAAVLMASGPAFLFQLVQPMSDVPVTAAWTGALLFALARRPALAGVCAAAAILTRPNLAPLAAWLAAAVWFDAGVGRAGTDTRPEWRTRLAATGSFVLATTPGVVAWMAINRAWYGSALASGYGPTGDLFSLEHVVANAERYGRWLLHAHTPFVLLAFTSPAVVWWASRRAMRSGAVAGAVERDGTGGEPQRLAGTRASAVALGFAALVVLAYLPYARFEEWTYLRFLLPALPVILILSCDVAVRAVSMLPGPGAVVLLVTGTTALGTYQCTEARRGQAFELQRLERRYVDAGRYALRALPPSAVLLAVQQSGSLRQYSGRPILRWDNLDPAWFDRALVHLRSRGYTPLIVLEAWEEPQFREHLSAATLVGRLDWPPSVQLDLAVKVRFYDPRDRAIFVAGGHVTTTRVSASALR